MYERKQICLYTHTHTPTHTPTHPTHTQNEFATFENMAYIFVTGMFTQKRRKKTVSVIIVNLDLCCYNIQNYR